MRILLMTNSAIGRYGYSVVGDHISKGLRDAGHQIIYFGLQEIHPPIKIDNITYLGIRYAPFGNDILENYLRVYKVESLLEIMDVWLDTLQYIPGVVKKLNIPLVTHVTVNSHPLSPFLARFLSESDYVVCPSKFVFNTVREVFGNDVYQISHGVDLNVFKPLSEKTKQKMKEKLKVEDKDFILVSVMRNKSPFQKNFAALFHAWKNMLANAPELQKKGILLCLTDPMEQGSIRLDLLRDRVGLRNFVRFIWTKPTEDLSGIEMTYEGDPEGFPHTANLNFSAEEMAKFYNIGDVHVISSFGESFNLPCLESQACGIPQINCNFSTGVELVGEPKTGLLADATTTITNPLITDQWIVDPESLFKCIHTLYTDEKLRKECSKRALEFASLYSWDKIIPRWIKLFEKVQDDMMKVDYRKQRLGI